MMLFSVMLKLVILFVMILLNMLLLISMKVRKVRLKILVVKNMFIMISGLVLWLKLVNRLLILVGLFLFMCWQICIMLVLNSGISRWVVIWLKNGIMLVSISMISSNMVLLIQIFGLMRNIVQFCCSQLKQVLVLILWFLFVKGDGFSGNVVVLFMCGC